MPREGLNALLRVPQEARGKAEALQPVLVWASGQGLHSVVGKSLAQTHKSALTLLCCKGPGAQSEFNQHR